MLEKALYPSRPVVHLLSGDLWGGSEAQMAMQLAALRESGVDVRAIFLNDGETSRRFSAQGIPCVFAEERFGLRHCFKTLRAQFRTLNPALIVSHGYKENILSSVCSILYGVPWIPVFHGLGEPFTGKKAIRASFYYRLSKFLSRIRAARIVMVSEALAKSLGFSGDGRVRIVRNVVTLVPAPERPDVLEGITPRNAKRVLSVGRLVPVKRLDLLIDAFASCNCPGSHLVIVGDGPEREPLRKRAADSRAASAIHFLGFRSDAHAIISQADVLVICSDSEGIPTVLLEALALGRKVIATEVGGIPEVIGLFPGYPAELIPPGSVNELSAAITQALSSSSAAPVSTPELLERYFSPRVAAAAHAALYRELIRVE